MKRIGAFHSAAQRSVKRLGEQRPACRIDGYPIAVESDLHPALGPELGVGAPADIGQQAGRMAQPLQLRGFPGKQRRNPLVEQVAMLRESP